MYGCAARRRWEPPSLELPLLGVRNSQNTTIEGPVLNGGKMPLHRVGGQEILISLYRQFHLYRIAYCMRLPYPLSRDEAEKILVPADNACTGTVHPLRG